MKRTEKIEIRVSAEEKSALASLAKSEGRPVSGIVRDVLDKYMALNFPNQNRRPVLPFMTGALCVGLVFGGGIAKLLTNEQSPKQYMVQGTIGTSGFSFSVNGKQLSEKTVKLGDGDETLFVKVKFESVESSSDKKLRVKICSDDGLDCNVLAEVALDLDVRYPSVWQTQSLAKEYVFVTVQPVGS